MHELYYDLVLDSLNNMLESGEIDYEDAKEISEAAFDTIFDDDDLLEMAESAYDDDDDDDYYEGYDDDDDDYTYYERKDDEWLKEKIASKEIHTDKHGNYVFPKQWDKRTVDYAKNLLKKSKSGENLSAIARADAADRKAGRTLDPDQEKARRAEWDKNLAAARGYRHKNDIIANKQKSAGEKARIHRKAVKGAKMAVAGAAIGAAGALGVKKLLDVRKAKQKKAELEAMTKGQLIKAMKTAANEGDEKTVALIKEVLASK